MRPTRTAPAALGEFGSSSPTATSRKTTALPRCSMASITSGSGPCGCIAAVGVIWTAAMMMLMKILRSAWDFLLPEITVPIQPVLNGKYRDPFSWVLGTPVWRCRRGARQWVKRSRRTLCNGWRGAHGGARTRNFWGGVNLVGGKAPAGGSFGGA